MSRWWGQPKRWYGVLPFSARQAAGTAFVHTTNADWRRSGGHWHEMAGWHSMGTA